MSISQVIKQYKKDYNMSTDAFAQDCGLHSRTIQFVEAGRLPSITTLQRLAWGMRMLPSELLSKAGLDVEPVEEVH